MTQLARQRFIYISSDFLTSALGVFCFNLLRYKILRDDHMASMESVTLESWLCELGVLIGQVLYPLLIVAFFALSGFYNRNQLYIRSRMDELISTLGWTFIATVVIYLGALINDTFSSRMLSYELMLLLWGCLFVPDYIARVWITTSNTRRLRSEGGGWRTLMVGVSEGAVAERRRMLKADTTLRIIGFLDPRRKHVPDGETLDGLPVVGMDARLRGGGSLDVNSLIVMPHPSGMESTVELINELYPLDLPLLLPPTLHNLITLRPRINSVNTEPLIDITNANISASTANFKRVADVIISAIALIILSPVLAIIALIIKLDSPGPVIYSQERIGYHKKPFRIHKFRTMFRDSEDAGPALSSEDDPRITRVGRFLRKYRLDELLQFWNVLVGEMSLVGPRPERDYYIHQIEARVPAYSLIHQVRPGITSWGMVAYGYATDVDEMIQRLRYDLLYIENVSFGVDLKILYHTIHTVLAGKGL